MGNVRVTFSDIKIPTGSGSQPFIVDLLSKSEYYPYGMKINDLSYNATGARYGYNGKEQDNEIKGDNNSIDFGARIYDPRVSRFLSQDPLIKDFAFQSPFIYAGDKPINSIDKDGEREHIMIFYNVTKHGNKFVTTYDDKMTHSENGNKRIWSDNKMGSAVYDNHYIYEEKLYNSKTSLPGKAGEYFKREEENTKNLVNSAVIGVPLALVSAPAMGGFAATWGILSSGYEMYASAKNNANNSTLNIDYLSPSLAGYLGHAFIEGHNKKFGRNYDPKWGELIGNSIELGYSIRSLNTNLVNGFGNLKQLDNYAQLPNDINSTINSGTNTFESLGGVIPNSDEGD